MKKQKKIYLEEDLLNIIERTLKNNKINFSAFIEYLIKENIKDMEPINFFSQNIQEKEIEKPRPIRTRISAKCYKELKKQAEAKNISITQEAKFRLTASLFNEIYDTIETRDLREMTNEIRKMGRLFNEARNLKLVINENVYKRFEDQFINIEKKLSEMIEFSTRRKI